jgi:hypothetical protein
MAALERVEGVTASLTAELEMEKLPPIMWQELTLVSHQILLGIIMMGRETEAHLLQVLEK